MNAKKAAAGIFDEWNGFDGTTRPEMAEVARWIAETPVEELRQKQEAAELIFSASASPSWSMAAKVVPNS